MAQRPHIPADDASGALDHPPLDEIVFAHASERVAAEILDYYRIRWQYEPKRFPIEWDGNGNVIAYFTPDFYLVDFDMYIELTTMSQKLVTKKNRKVRRLKELYPEINIKVFYQKDFRALLARFGLNAQAIPHAGGGGLVARSDAQTDLGEEPGDEPGNHGES
jgi:hypothetical protein